MIRQKGSRCAHPTADRVCASLCGDVSRKRPKDQGLEGVTEVNACFSLRFRRRAILSTSLWSGVMLEAYGTPLYVCLSRLAEATRKMAASSMPLPTSVRARLRPGSLHHGRGTKYGTTNGPPPIRQDRRRSNDGLPGENVEAVVAQCETLLWISELLTHRLKLTFSALGIRQLDLPSSFRP